MNAEFAPCSFEVSAITYNQNQTGTYYYTIEEIIPGDAKNEAGTKYSAKGINDIGPWTLNGVTYDETPHTATVVIGDNGDGTLSKTVTYDTTGIPVFTNSYNAEGEAQLFAKKADGGNLGDRKFAFVLKNENGEAIQTVTNIGANQTATFNKFTYSDVSKVGSYTYYISEVNDGQEGVSYDGHTATVTIEVTDAGNGKLDVTYNGSKTYETPVFTNSYNAEGEAQLFARKADGGNLGTRVFNFVLKDKDGKEVQTVKGVGKNELAEFDKFTYSDVSKVGSYTYYISEVNDGQEGVSYDGHTATVTIDRKSTRLNSSHSV